MGVPTFKFLFFIISNIRIITLLKIFGVRKQNRCSRCTLIVVLISKYI